MRFYILLFSLLFLFSCEKSQDFPAPVTDNTFLSCDINNANMYTNTITASVNNSDMLSVVADDGVHSITIRVYNFSDKNIGDTVYFSVPGMGIVLKDGVTFSNLYSPPYDGILIFSDITSSTISGDFYFKAQDVAVGSFTNVNVINGLFQNILYY